VSPVCGRDWGGFGGVTLCCVWDSLVRCCGSEFVLCVVLNCVGLGERVFAVCGTVWCGFGGVSVCCVWERLGRVWGSEFVLCVGQFIVGVWDRVFAVCGTVWIVSGDRERVLCVG